MYFKGTLNGQFGYLHFSLNMWGQPRKYEKYYTIRGVLSSLKSLHTCPFPRATVQFPQATVQFPCTTVQFLKLLSSFLELLSSLYFSFRVTRKQGRFLYFFFFSSDIHPSITVYLFFQICTFFPIYWHYTHYARFELFVLLSSSSRYCPVSRATVQFLVLLCSFLMLLSSMLQ